MTALSVAAALAFVLLPGVSQAANGPRWSLSQLGAFADVVITGRVVAVNAGWDPKVDAIYTYVTVDVAEVLKGEVTDPRVTIKQLGGEAGALGLLVSDQATFTVGEDVLLYLEARPRDGTLYTTALWQGKWAVQQDLRGQRMAVRQAPRHHHGGDERHDLAVARRSANTAHQDSVTVGKRRVSIVTRPVETPSAVAASVSGTGATAHFTLLGPFRYLHSPSVDVQAGGQPGLPGGGFTELLSAINRWNAAGANFRFLPGHGNGAPRCSTQQLNNGRVTISFMDPCGEMSNTGGTLALGGSYYFPGSGGSSNGQLFGRAVEGFIINNDSPTALQFLNTPGCFEDIQTHELGHVLGLNHSTDPTALMFGSIDRATCANGARGLQPDDVEGIRYIYGGTVASPHSAPSDVTIVSGATTATVSWSSVAEAASQPITYRVDFRAGHQDGGAVLASLTTSATTMTVNVPAGVSGAFNVVVTAMNAAGSGPASARVDFTIPTHTSCSTAPSAVQGVIGAVNGEYASVQWDRVAGATSYQIQVGSAAGGADLLPLIDLGSNPGAGASVPPGFAAWIRVYAVNQCGRSQPIDYFLH